MKTIEEKAKEYARQCVRNPDSNEYLSISSGDIYDYINESYIAGAIENQPQVKQLEWKKDGSYYIAETKLGIFTVVRDFGSYISGFEYNDLSDGEFKTITEAKQACQEDFEKRIRKCLI